MNQRYTGFIYRGTNMTAYENAQLDQRIRDAECVLGRFQWPWNEEDDDDDE